MADLISNEKLPKHIGIIMDGNGRWAKMRGKERSYGHQVGSDNVERVISYAFERGIKVMSLYAFSCENWARPKPEVDELMRLLDAYMKKFIKEHDDENGTVMADFNTLRGRNEKGEEIEGVAVASYGEIKKWFLGKYEKVSDFGKNHINDILGKKVA